jgi:enoyl-CoA hydratase/carnithine racemase
MNEITSIAGRVRAEKEGRIGWLIFDHPARLNAISLEMLDEMGAHLRTFAADDAVRVVILRGAGDKAFISGGDISQFAERRGTVEAVEAANKLAEPAWNALTEIAKPTIAMIRGYCLGGGLATALRCDLRYTAEDGVFGIPAARLGVGYRFEDVKRLADTVGQASARDILYTGRRIKADEALAMRLVNRVLPAAELEKSVRELAATLIDNAPLSIRAAKIAIEEALNTGGERDITRCRDAVRACFASADYAEGRTAFMEKRRPDFKGK